MKHYKIIAITTVMFSMMFSGCRKYLDFDGMDQLPQFGSCKAVPYTGHLSQSPTGITTYATSGGGHIKIDGYTFTFTHKDYTDFKIEFWGMIHENLKGKHMKDFLGNRRSLIFPDGTKITIVNTELNESIKSISILDGNEYHHYNFICKTLEYSCVNSIFAKKLDEAEADGETATFEITATGLLFYNIYIENTPGNKNEEKVLIGETFKDDPKRTNDYYDDPRLMNT